MIASLPRSDGSKSFLRLLPGDLHFHLVALGASKGSHSLLSNGNRVAPAPGVRDRKDTKQALAGK